jgi:hypothetical protein
VVASTEVVTADGSVKPDQNVRMALLYRLLMIVGRLLVPIENRAIAGTHANADIYVASFIFARWDKVKTR